MFIYKTTLICLKQKSHGGLLMNKTLMRYIVCVGIILTTFSAAGIPFASADAPTAPSGPYPAQGSSGVTIFISLHWVGDNQSLTYDVYFGTNNQPPLVMTNLSTTTYNPGMLLDNTTYYWQVVAYNAQQESTASPIWFFSTAPDTPPFRPTILAGPIAAGKDILLNFTAIAPDPEGDQVYYQWDWGNGNISEWFGPYAFGDHAVASYKYAHDGNYSITVRAKDVHGQESSWSTLYPVTIAQQLEITNLKQGYVYFNFFGIDLGYGYIYSLDLLGMTLFISNQEFSISSKVTGNVHLVQYEMTNLFSTDERWTTTDDNLSNSTSTATLQITAGLYQVTASAYDTHGNLIDQVTRSYVIYYQWQFTVIKKLLSKFTGGIIS